MKHFGTETDYLPPHDTDHEENDGDWIETVPDDGTGVGD